MTTMDEQIAEVKVDPNKAHRAVQSLYGLNADDVMAAIKELGEAALTDAAIQHIAEAQIIRDWSSASAHD